MVCIKKINKLKLRQRSKTMQNLQEDELKTLEDDQVDHRNIIKLFKIFETEHFKYIIFEYLPLGSLKFHMTKENGYSDKDIKYIIRQTVYALSALH